MVRLENSCCGEHHNKKEKWKYIFSYILLCNVVFLHFIYMNFFGVRKTWWRWCGQMCCFAGALMRWHLLSEAHSLWIGRGSKIQRSNLVLPSLRTREWGRNSGQDNNHVVHRNQSTRGHGVSHKTFWILQKSWTRSKGPCVGSLSSPIVMRFLGGKREVVYGVMD